MQDLRDKTAVITGAASGIGLALAQRGAREGMRLVLADIEGEKLATAAAALSIAAERLSLHTLDVSRDEDIGRMADDAFQRFGAVHLLCNNAGVGLARVTWEHTLQDWEWQLGVNLWSVIHGIRHFLPRMLKQADGGHIVNTASAAGLSSTQGMAAYNVSKHGVVTLSETLYSELAALQAKVGVSVLCPAWVPTAIHQSGRNRQARFGVAGEISEVSRGYEERMASAVTAGRKSADDMADAVFEAVAAQRFYVIPHRKINHAIQLRMDDIMQQRNPTPLG
ncbi:MAG: SDR family NAD(P)-dependent oxidoreductase [Betaproteobacteria bacterium]|nr:SDR family NAD(P)-dependent oxidoreductase [Betaproteobacteria bacterium]